MLLTWQYIKSKLRLDIVSLFAVIGESAMSAHSQPLTASILCLLPRIFKTPPGVIHVQAASPLTILSIGSFLLSVGLGIWAIILQDWAAVFTVVAVSLTSTIMGLSSLWHPTLTERKSKLVVPDGDLV